MEILTRIFRRRHKTHQEPSAATPAATSDIEGSADNWLQSFQTLLALYAQGINLLRENHLEAALRCFDEATHLDPRDALLQTRWPVFGDYEAWGYKGVILYQLGRFEEAITCHNTTIEIRPGDCTAWVSKGNCLEAMGRFDEALNCYEKALEMSPNNTDGLYARGRTLAKLGRHEDAICSYDRTFQSNVWLDPPDVWTAKGNSLVALRRYEEAICSYNRAIEGYSKRVDLRPGELFPPLYNKAVAEDELGRKEDAARSFKKAIEMASDQQARERDRARSRLVELGVACRDGKNG